MSKPTSQIWTDFAEDKTIQRGWWRLITHPDPSESTSKHEFALDGPAGIHSALNDGSVRWYNYPDEMELAAFNEGGVPGNWWGKPGGLSWDDN